MSRSTRLATAAVGIVGIAFGLGAFTFGYARGYSYLTNEPAACANCHIMREHYDAWMKASHRSVATCNACHTPHKMIAKYATKALNGFWHSFYFTTGRYPDPLRITARNRRVTESACRDCHGEITEAIDPRPEQPHANPARASKRFETSCVRCHSYVGHFVR